MRGNGWWRVWCVLQEDMLYYRSDEQMGAIHLQTGYHGRVQVYSYGDADAPPEAAALAWAKPYGFWLHSGQSFFFDAGSENLFSLWLRALRRVIGSCAEKVKEKRRSLPPAMSLPKLSDDAADDEGVGGEPWKPRRYHGSGPNDLGAPFQWMQVTDNLVVPRAVPHVEAPRVGDPVGLGQLMQVRIQEFRDDGGNLWAELSPFEAWRRHVDAPRRAFVPVQDGDVEHLFLLPKHDWPQADEAELAGLPWSARDCGAVRPPLWRDDNERLDYWQPEAIGRATSSSDTAARLPGVRVAASVLILPGTPPEVVESWLLYHLRIGFEKFFVFLDDPEDEVLPAIDKVRQLLRHQQEIILQTMGRKWWSDAIERSRFCRNADAAWAAPVIKDHALFGDMGARKQLVCDLAIQDAVKMGVEWFMHLEIWELLYLPPKHLRENAAAFFGLVSPEVDVVKFFTQEGILDKSESTDWFRDVTLFKPAKPFLRRRAHQEGSNQATHRTSDITSPRATKGHDAHGNASMESKGCTLAVSPCRWGEVSRSEREQAVVSDVIAKRSSKAISASAAKRLTSAMSTLAATAASAAAVASSSPSAEAGKSREAAANNDAGGGDHDRGRGTRTRSSAGAGAKFTVPTSSDVAAGAPSETPPQQHQRRFPAANADSVYLRVVALASALRNEAAKKLNLPELSEHFLWSQEGRSAVRLKKMAKSRKIATTAEPPIPDGLHNFVEIVNNKKVGLVRLQMDGSSAPVVLHYGHTDFDSWVKHYQVLGDFPDELHSPQAHLPAHLASRDLVHKASLNQTEQFFEIFARGNAFGELSLLSFHGLAVRVKGAREVLLRAHTTLAEKKERDLARAANEDVGTSSDEDHFEFHVARVDDKIKAGAQRQRKGKRKSTGQKKQPASAAGKREGEDTNWEDFEKREG